MSFSFVHCFCIKWHNICKICLYQDQWMSSKPSKESPEVKPSGMKSSVSAPSRLPSVKAPQNDSKSLFDNNEDDDLFAATNESRFVYHQWMYWSIERNTKSLCCKVVVFCPCSKKSSQRVSLLFEDEDDDEDKEPLFGFKTPANKTPSEPKVSVA